MGSTSSTLNFESNQLSFLPRTQTIPGSTSYPEAVTVNEVYSVRQSACSVRPTIIFNFKFFLIFIILNHSLLRRWPNVIAWCKKTCLLYQIKLGQLGICKTHPGHTVRVQKNGRDYRHFEYYSFISFINGSTALCWALASMCQSQCYFDFTLTENLRLCGGGVEYLHRNPASRRRRRKGNSVPGSITRPSCSWEI
jgi:hypothetical protein